MMDNFKHFLVENKHDFSSTQINLPRKLADEIISWGFKNLSEDIIFNNYDDLFFGREDDIHVTVLYGIHTNNFNLILDLLKSQEQFNCCLEDISLFTDNPKFDVLKINVKAPELHKLNSLLKSKLTVTINYPEYIPHVTIAYLNKRKGNKFINNEIFNGRNFLVNKIIFSSKNGEKRIVKLKEKK